jgi:hypothetical protein
MKRFDNVKALRRQLCTKLCTSLRTYSNAYLLCCVSLLAAPTTWAAANEPLIKFIVRPTDTLIGLSTHVLTSPGAWRQIAQLNKLANPDRVYPGQTLIIPARLMRTTSAELKLVGATGDVRSGPSNAAAKTTTAAVTTAASVGSTLAEGQVLETGADSSAVLEMADGSQLRLPPFSAVKVLESRQYGLPGRSKNPPTIVDNVNPADGWFAGSMRLLRGSIEIFASKVLRAKPLEVVTPTAVIGVRGTQYRIGLDDTLQRTHAEVLEGGVRFDAGPVAATATAGNNLSAGSGASLASGASAPTVATLLAAPSLSTLPTRFERPVVRFTLPAESSSTPLRVQVASDDTFKTLVRDQRVEPGAEVRIAELADAQWHVRARRIDTNGIEGMDATQSFVLKATPQPPAYRLPRNSSKQAVGSVDFAWANNVDAPQTRLQVAEDAAFSRIVQDQTIGSGGSSGNDGSDSKDSLRIDLPKPANYFWRLASIRASGDQGPFGDAQAFELRPAPEVPVFKRDADQGTLRFSWSGRTIDKQQVQFASDVDFKTMVAEAELSALEWQLPSPKQPGRYYFRYRSVEPDGFITPYSETLTVEVPREWRELVPLLLPLLLLF